MQVPQQTAAQTQAIRKESNVSATSGTSGQTGLKVGAREFKPTQPANKHFSAFAEFKPTFSPEEQKQNGGVVLLKDEGRPRTTPLIQVPKSTFNTKASAFVPKAKPVAQPKVEEEVKAPKVEEKPVEKKPEPVVEKKKEEPKEIEEVKAPEPKVEAKKEEKVEEKIPEPSKSAFELVKEEL
jgi:hypothetical protein